MYNNPLCPFLVGIISTYTYNIAGLTTVS